MAEPDQRVLGCETCGEVSADLRLLVFYTGRRGMYCAFHAKLETAAAVWTHFPVGAESPISEAPPTREPLEENADLLRRVASELRRRGEESEARKADAAVGKFAKKIEKELKAFEKRAKRMAGSRNHPYGPWL